MGSNRRIKALGNTFLFLSILILSACGEDGGKEGNGNGKGHSVRHDSWQATSTGGGPSARGWHTTVWTGSPMIVWGGYDLAKGLNTGARYNPATDTWQPTSLTNAPWARSAHTAVWTGSEMIIGGGISLYPIFTLYNTGGRYTP